VISTVETSSRPDRRSAHVHPTVISDGPDRRRRRCL